MAKGVDEGHISKKKFIQHTIFAHNTQGNFLNKTENVWNKKGILFLKSCEYPIIEVIDGLIR